MRAIVACSPLVLLLGGHAGCTDADGELNGGELREGFDASPPPRPDGGTEASSGSDGPIEQNRGMPLQLSDFAFSADAIGRMKQWTATAPPRTDRER